MINWQHLFLPLFTVQQYLFCTNSIIRYSFNTLPKKQIEDTYEIIKKYHTKYLKSHGVQLPSLKRGNNYTKDALVLVYLAQGYPNTEIISKTELTEFIKTYYPGTNDVQQARHLAAQKGHKDPSKPLAEGNIIPQCEQCNRPDRNYWIYDDKGRIISISNEKVIDTCSEELQEKIYSRLYHKYNGKNPDYN